MSGCCGGLERGLELRAEGFKVEFWELQVVCMQLKQGARS